MCRAVENFVMSGEWKEEDCAKCEAALRAKLEMCKKKKERVKRIIAAIDAQTMFVWEPSEKDGEEEKKRERKVKK